MKKTILVIGATGAQGGSVAKHLLDRDRFAVRAFTRNPESDAARDLAFLGAEVVKGDLADRASIRAALKGVYGVFGIAKESEHARNLIHAVAGVEIEHFVWSSDELTDYAQSLGVPTTSIEVAFYFDHFFDAAAPRRNGDGAFHLHLHESPLPGIAMEDVGGVVAAIFERPEEFIGQRITVAADVLAPSEYAAVLSRATGQEVRSDDAAQATSDLDVRTSRTLYPAMQSFKQWSTRHAPALTRMLAE